jgi:hypothetical protein
MVPSRHFRNNPQVRRRVGLFCGCLSAFLPALAEAPPIAQRSRAFKDGRDLPP